MLSNIIANGISYCDICHPTLEKLLNSVPFLIPNLVLSNALFASEPYNSGEEIQKARETIAHMFKNPQDFGLVFS